jgi:hypothetical protein
MLTLQSKMQPQIKYQLIANLFLIKASLPKKIHFSLFMITYLLLHKRFPCIKRVKVKGHYLRALKR